MKRASFILLVALAGALTFTCNGQSNSKLAAPNGAYKNGSFPLFSTGVRTVTPSAVDSIKMKMYSGWETNSMSHDVKTLTFTNSVTKSAGTPTVTATLYATADNDTSAYAGTALGTYTLYPTTTYPVKCQHTVNVTGGGGNPETHYVWVVGTSASSTVTNKSSILIR